MRSNFVDQKNILISLQKLIRRSYKLRREGEKLLHKLKKASNLIIEFTKIGEF